MYLIKVPLMLVWINCSTIKSNVITKEKHQWKCCRCNEIILSFIKQVKCNTIKRQSRVFRSKTNLSFRLKRVVGNFHYPFQYLRKILFFIFDSILCLGRPTWYSYIHKFFVSTRAGNRTFDWSAKIRCNLIYSLMTISMNRSYLRFENIEKSTLKSLHVIMLFILGKSIVKFNH